MLGNNQACELKIEDCIDLIQEKQLNEILLYREYNNLFIHCLKNNIDKAILIGKALLSPGEIEKIPLSFQKIFIFNLGTAYFLNGNYVDAKARLRECLGLDPNPLLKAMALNNLGLAC